MKKRLALAICFSALALFLFGTMALREALAFDPMLGDDQADDWVPGQQDPRAPDRRAPAPSVEVPLPAIRGIDPHIGPAQFIQYLFVLGLGLGGVLAFAMIVFAGLQWSLSGANPSLQQDAADRIQNAIFGLVLLLGAYVILNTINPDLVRLDQPVFHGVQIPPPGAPGIQRRQQRPPTDVVTVEGIYFEDPMRRWDTLAGATRQEIIDWLNGLGTRNAIITLNPRGDIVVMATPGGQIKTIVQQRQPVAPDHLGYIDITREPGALLGRLPVNITGEMRRQILNELRHRGISIVRITEDEGHTVIKDQASNSIITITGGRLHIH